MIRARKVNPLMMHRLASTVITPAGFNLVKQSEVTDLKLNLVEMEHAQTGAKWVHINKESEVNKVFNICFRTVPMTDNGVAHILEHIGMWRVPFIVMSNLAYSLVRIETVPSARSFLQNDQSFAKQFHECDDGHRLYDVSVCHNQ